MAQPRKRKPLDFIVEGARNLQSAVSFSLSPGLNFFEGVNGAGKTTLLECLSAWAGRKVSIPVNDTASKIRIHGPGMLVEIGRTRKEDGSPSIELVADDFFSDLVEPTGKEAKIRSKNRVEAFLRFRPLDISADLLLRLCGGDETIAAAVQAKNPSWQAFGIDEAAEAARREANSLAAQLEGAVSTKKGAGSTLLRQAEELAEDIIEVPEETAADLAAQVDSVSRNLGEMRIKAKGRVDLERQQEDIRGSLGQRPDVQSLEMAVTIAEEEVRELTAKLREAEKRRAAGEASLAAARDSERAWLRSNEILSQPLAGPTAEDLAASEMALAGLKEKHAAAEKEARRLGLKAQALQHLDAAREAEGQAQRFRAIAQTVKMDVGRILEEQGLDGVTFLEGELAVETPEGVRAVDRLSFGERVDFALRVALPAYREADLPPVFWLRESFWYALDPEKQDRLELAAKEEGIYFAIERPTGGALQVRNRSAKEVRPA